MAITITNPIQLVNWGLASGNPISFKAVSDQHGVLDRLHYKIYVKIDGAVVCTLLMPSIDADGIVVDVRNIVNDYLSSQFCNDITIEFYHTSECISLSLQFVERYHNGTSWSDNTSVYSSDEYFVWLSAADFQMARDCSEINRRFERGEIPWMGVGVQYQFTDLSNSAAGMAYKKKLFANPYMVGDGSKKDTFRTATSMKYYTGQDGTTIDRNYFHLCTFDKEFNTMKHFVFNSSSAPNDVKHKLRSFPVGIAGLNSIQWTTKTLWNGVYNYINPLEDVYYCVWCSTSVQASLNMNVANSTQVIPFKMCGIYRYDIYYVLYKCSNGGWWQIRCDRKHSREKTVDNSYRIGAHSRAPQTLLGNDASYKVTEHVSSNGAYTLNTDWIARDGNISEVEDMIQSPQIYIMTAGITGPVYTPVVLKSTDVAIKNVAQDKLVQYQFQFEEAYYQPVIR